MKYGRRYYDLQEESLMLLAPGQAITVTGTPEKKVGRGWALFFHPDLIRKHPFGKKMKEYSFFFYDAYEALYLFEREKQTITGIVRTIEGEYSQNLDEYSQERNALNITCRI